MNTGYWLHLEKYGTKEEDNSIAGNSENGRNINLNSL